MMSLDIVPSMPSMADISFFFALHIRFPVILPKLSKSFTPLWEIAVSSRDDTNSVEASLISAGLLSEAERQHEVDGMTT